MSQQFTDNNRT
uniref:Uncharacterized protein n=1 Tax=Anguilla anguilla TaxID=7936 RepID=A0A0E9U6C7_ANGAN